MARTPPHYSANTPDPFRYAAAAAAVRCRSGDLPTPQTVQSLMETL